jgi:hypothetical protein
MVVAEVRMKVVLLIAAMSLTAPAFADTAPPASSPPSAPVNKAAKTDFTKPFIDDRLARQAPEPSHDHPTVELRAAPGTK